MEDKESYSCFPIYGLESEDEDHGMKTPSNPATPATPNTPHTPASDETDRSTFSVSMDSGIESPQGYQITTNQLHNLGPIQPLIPTPGRPAASVKAGLKSAAKQNDHTTKEKLRRERIKDSCDQLRVLLPYIRGRKTDMASILEMCVDYLQIVNSVMPQQLHNQIVDILSKDPSLVPNKDMKTPKGKKAARELESPSARVSSTVDSRGSSPASQVSNGDIKKPRPSVITFQAQDVTKRDVHPMMSDKANKRLRIGSDSMLPPNGDDTLAHNTLGLTTGQVDGGISHNSLGSVDDEFGLFNGGQKSGLNKSAFSDVDAYGRSYNIPSTEPFGTQLYNTYATAKSQTLERDSYQVYMDAPLYRYYYSGLHQNVGASAQSRFFSETMDYVNPNSVLSTASYGSGNSGNAGNARLKLEGGEVIEDLNTPVSDGREKIEVTVIQNSP